MSNPYLVAGPLNRVRCHVVIAAFTALNITPQYMGKSFCRIEFEGDFTTQIETATGVVNSPEPYVMATITVGLLRSQALASSWLSQVQSGTILGDVTIYSDTSSFPAITLNDTAVRMMNPGAYDGTDPVVGLTLRGTFNVNSSLWNPT
ncbi:hypothetical protein [Paraburkholderia sp. J11-2]|uniref:hypothetical protein n=1 Tax=Paraburkholderia sp. J11-2 TaxID=2805431 RepID=UPI002AB7210B|nr:hypothetical protein [Paraburkholderia sp. J11-2]